MSYTDLSTMKKINGVPVDLRYFEELNENDAFLKSAADNDEDLSALDRDIIPTINEQFDLGSNTKAFNEIFVNTVRTAYVNVLAGDSIIPALQIGLTGLASLNPNQLSFMGSPGLESIRFKTSGLLVRAANNAQLSIENTLPGSTGTWSIGSDNTGLYFSDAIASGTKLKLSATSVDILNKLSVPEGTLLQPSIFFGSDLMTGFSKDSTAAILNFSISGVKQLALGADGLELPSGKLTIPTGTSEEPSLNFIGISDLGLSALDNNNLAIIVGGEPLHKFSNDGTSSIIEGNSFSTKRVYSTGSWHTDVIGLANGALATPLPLAADQDVYAHAVEGYTDAGWQRISELIVKAQEDYSLGAYGSSYIFSTIPMGGTELVERLMLGQNQVASVHVPESIGLGKVLLSTPGLGQEINIAGTSKLIIDATGGNIEIQGFVGGQEGQMLYIYKKVTTNTFTLVFNSATATQKVLLKGSANYTNTNDYGGITLSFDDGIWREVSRS